MPPPAFNVARNVVTMVPFMLKGESSADPPNV
jgi:hypothetical protein